MKYFLNNGKKQTRLKKRILPEILTAEKHRLTTDSEPGPDSGTNHSMKLMTL